MTLAFSPCPNDCFIFDALVHHKIDTGGLNFEVVLEDVESLNQHALQARYDITKLSFHAYAYCLKNYILLRSGSALGFGCGPLLISKKEIRNPEAEIKTVAIPGKLTTANFLFSLAFPHIGNKKEMVFSEIENEVLNEKVDAGLIIHENRFTYQQKGLKKIMDLGEYWESLHHAPIPLGGITIKRNVDNELKTKINLLIKKSIAYAFANPDGAMPYVRAHAQEMSEAVMKQHIDLYVNRFSSDLGTEGTRAVELMFEQGKKENVFEWNEKHILHY